MSGAPLLMRAMRSTVSCANAPGGTTSCTPSGPFSVPPAAPRVALTSLGGSSLPPHAATADTAIQTRMRVRSRQYRMPFMEASARKLPMRQFYAAGR